MASAHSLAQGVSAAVEESSCCVQCGDGFADSTFMEVFRPFEGPDLVIMRHENGRKIQRHVPRSRFGNSAYLRLFLKPGMHTKPLTFDADEICRRQLRGHCDKGAGCKFLHVCRQFWQGPTLAPAAAIPAAVQFQGKQVPPVPAALQAVIQNGVGNFFAQQQSPTTANGTTHSRPTGQHGQNVMNSSAVIGAGPFNHTHANNNNVAKGQHGNKNGSKNLTNASPQQQPNLGSLPIGVLTELANMGIVLPNTNARMASPHFAPFLGMLLNNSSVPTSPSASSSSNSVSPQTVVPLSRSFNNGQQQKVASTRHDQNIHYPQNHRGTRPSVSPSSQQHPSFLQSCSAPTSSLAFPSSQPSSSAAAAAAKVAAAAATKISSPRHAAHNQAFASNNNSTSSSLFPSRPSSHPTQANFNAIFAPTSHLNSKNAIVSSQISPTMTPQVFQPPTQSNLRELLANLSPLKFPSGDLTDYLSDTSAPPTPPPAAAVQPFVLTPTSPVGSNTSSSDPLDHQVQDILDNFRSFFASSSSSAAPFTAECSI